MPGGEQTSTALTADAVAISLDAVSVARGGSTIVGRADLQVQASEFVCLLGLSGCGKSTLLRAIGGLIPLASGAVTVGGRSVDEAWRDLAYVFQSPLLIPWRTVADNVRLGIDLRLGRAHKKAERQRRNDRVHELLELVGLEQMASNKAGVLSGGEQQRVSIARALAVEPRALLMDEPFSALDVRTRERLRSVILDVWAKTGITVLFVTHDIVEAVALGQRAVVLDGRPSSVVADIPIDLARPRQADDPAFRTSVDAIASIILGPSASTDD